MNGYQKAKTSLWYALIVKALIGINQEKKGYQNENLYDLFGTDS